MRWGYLFLCDTPRTYSSGQSPGQERCSLLWGGSKWTKLIAERQPCSSWALCEAFWSACPKCECCLSRRVNEDQGKLCPQGWPLPPVPVAGGWAVTPQAVFWAVAAVTNGNKWPRRGLVRTCRVHLEIMLSLLEKCWCMNADFLLPTFTISSQCRWTKK